MGNRLFVISIIAATLWITALNVIAEGSIEFRIDVYDARFAALINRDSPIEILASDLGWAEGPVWSVSLDSLLFSDVAADKIYRWNEKNGLNDYLSPSGHLADEPAAAWRGSNGLAIDGEGRLLLAQQSRRVIAVMQTALGNPQARFKVLASQYQGLALNSPNDLLWHQSGDIYFTDPPYGLAGFENSADIELDFFGVFRLTRDGELSVLNKSLEKPNGLALSIDQSTLYVSNSQAGRERIVAIDLGGVDLPLNSRLLFDAADMAVDGPGSTDGMAMHISGILFASLPNGFGLISAKGELLGKISIGQVTNLAFDASYSYLYLTTPRRLLRLRLNPDFVSSSR